LLERGYACAVLSPSSIPRRAGTAVKTDRIDAAELVEFYASGLLTIVVPPAAEVEQDRDLLRSRQRLIQHPLIQKEVGSAATPSSCPMGHRPTASRR